MKKEYKTSKKDDPELKLSDLYRNYFSDVQNKAENNQSSEDSFRVFSLYEYVKVSYSNGSN